MKIQVYVLERTSAAQLEWAKGLREKGHKVHFALDRPFNRVEVCDAYVDDGDNPDIAVAYQLAGIPVYNQPVTEVVEPVIEEPKEVVEETVETPEVVEPTDVKTEEPKKPKIIKTSGRKNKKNGAK